MTRDSYTYDWDYEVSFDYELGYSGSYDRAPEEHEIEVISIWDNYENKEVTGYEFNSMLRDVEEDINDYLNNL